MEKDIVDGTIGKLGAYEIDITGMQLIAKAKIESNTGDGILKIEADASVVLDLEVVVRKIVASTKGTLDDQVAEMLIAALKGAK